MNDHSTENEFELEPDEELGDIGAAQVKLKKLKDELTQVKIERQEYLDGWQRSKADAVNARKEIMAQAERASARDKEALMEELIPVIDSFDMAAASEMWATIDDGFRTGMEHVRNQLIETLARHGMERFGKVGDAYSPYLHDIAEERDDVAGESGTIARILRFGYKSGDRIIRPAQVIIKN